MGNKFDYQNMLNKIRNEKISSNKTPQFTNEQIDAWNNAIELCYHIVEGRRSKFEPSENSLHKHDVSGSAYKLLLDYERELKDKLPEKMEELRGHVTHAKMCDAINEIRVNFLKHYR